MMYYADYWDVVWSRPYGRYNKHHEAIWKELEAFVQGKVCDFGCGPCLLYKGKSIDLTGVDFSSKGIEEAKNNYPEGKYVVADICDTGLPDKTFDTVLLSGVLDYYKDWERPLAEARRICKNGGKIFGTLYNGFQGHDWSKYKHITGNWHIYEE